MAKPTSNALGQSKSRFYKKKGFRLFLMVLPFMVLVFLLSYLPLYGWVYSFFNYKPGIPLSADNFVGLDNYRFMVLDKYALKDLARVLGNTFGMSFLNILCTPLPMLFAIFLSELRSIKFKRIVQTLTTIPNFISWVLVYSVAYGMFSVNDGFVNRLLMQLGVINQGVNFLASGEHVWLGMTLWSIWKTLGWSAIMYFSAITSIDQEQYEAARVDGASRLQSIWHITIPGLLPTYFVLLIMQIANFLNNGLDQYFVFKNPMNAASIEVLDLFVYNQGMVGSQISYSIAVGILKSLVSLVLLFSANTISRVVRKESVF